MNSLTAQAGRFLSDGKFEQLPPEVLATVPDAFSDTIGVIMARIDQPIAGILRNTLVEPAGRKESHACISTHLVTLQDGVDGRGR